MAQMYIWDDQEVGSRATRRAQGGRRIPKASVAAVSTLLQLSGRSENGFVKSLELKK